MELARTRTGKYRQRRAQTHTPWGWGPRPGALALNTPAAFVSNSVRQQRRQLGGVRKLSRALPSSGRSR